VFKRNIQGEEEEAESFCFHSRLHYFE